MFVASTLFSNRSSRIARCARHLSLIGIALLVMMVVGCQTAPAQPGSRVSSPSGKSGAALSDADIYRLGLRTTDEGVVRASLNALNSEPGGYEDLLRFAHGHYVDRSGLYAVQHLVKYAARPGYTDDIAGLYAATDPRIATANELGNVYQVRHLLLSHLVSAHPERYAEAYLGELPFHLKGVEYRIGFNNRDHSRTLMLLKEHNLLAETQRVALAPAFLRTFEEAFHSSEHEEAMRCLHVLTGIEAEYDRRDKDKALAPYRAWLAAQRAGA